MRQIFLIFTLVITIGISPAYAGERIDYSAIEREGFGDVGDILKQMTSEQRADVLKQAKIIEQDLKKMSADERRRLEIELRTIASSLDLPKIDARKIKTEKSKDMKEIRNDFKLYKEKKKIR